MAALPAARRQAPRRDADQVWPAGDDELAGTVSLGGDELLAAACGTAAAGDWQEAASAAELLELSSEGELDRFFRSLIREALPAVPAAEPALIAMLKRTVAQLLPLVGMPFGAVTDHGHEAGLADRPGARLGLDLEGLSAQDKEFELARWVVRFGRSAALELAGPRPAPSPSYRSTSQRAGHPVGLPPAQGGNMRYRTDSEQEGSGNWRRRRGRMGRDSEGEGEFPFGFGGWHHHNDRWGHRRWRDWGDGEGEGYPSGGAGEQQFLPLLPIIGSVLGGLFKEVEAEASGEYPEYEGGDYRPGRYGPGEGGYGEAEWGEAEHRPGEFGEGEAEYESGEYESEQFLGGIIKSILGSEAEQARPVPVLSPAHEAELASQLMEVSSEAELENFLGGLVNLVGRAVSGARDFASSPTGQAVIQAVKPLAKSALPAIGSAIGSAIAPGAGGAVGRALGTAASSLFEVEYNEMSGEQAEYELARRVVQLTSAAARSAALAPPGAPPGAIGEVAVLHEARFHAPGLYRRGLFRFHPHAGHFGGFGHRWGGYHGGGWRGRSWGRRYGGWGHPWGRHGWYGRGYGGYAPHDPFAVEPPAGPPEEPPPAAPGYRWVAVPIDAPSPGGPAGPPGPDGGGQGPAGPGGPGGSGGPGVPPPQGEAGPHYRRVKGYGYGG